MVITRRWAFWRRLQYGGAVFILLALFSGWVSYRVFYQPPNCFDTKHNGNETGIDCGGGCLRVCAAIANHPVVRWSRSFKVTNGQYNAVAYVENSNQEIGAPELNYTFSLFDADGLIIKRSGTTFLPPNGTYPIFVGRIFTGDRVPTNTLIELEPVNVWLPVAVGREQFRLVGRELRATDTKPRLNATLFNNDRTAVSEVEVVATIFNIEGEALTASKTVVDRFAPNSDSDMVFTWPEPIAKTIRSCEVPTDVVIAIDLSGSMNNDQADPPEPISSVLVAAESFLKRLGPRDQAGLVTFATKAVVAEPLAKPAIIARRVLTLTIDPAEEQGNTNTGDAFVRAYELFASDAKNPNARKVMVLLTDGLATAPENQPEAYARTRAQALQNTGVVVYTIGLGQAVNMDFARSLASTNANAYQALTRGDVDRIYQEITSALCESGPTRIDIIPKTDAFFPKFP